MKDENLKRKAIKHKVLHFKDLHVLLCSVFFSNL